MKYVCKAALLAALALAAACGGGGASSTGGASAAADTAAPAAPNPENPPDASGAPQAPGAAASADGYPEPDATAPPGAIVLTARYERAAELVQVSLNELGVPEPHDAASATASGAIDKALVRNGTLRYVTGDDSGRPRPGQVRIASGGKLYVVPFLVSTSMPSEAFSPDHGGEDGSPGTDTPALIVSGLSPHNVIGTQPIRFTTADHAQFDPQHSTGRIIDWRGHELDPRDYWTYDAADRSFTIAGEALQRLRAALSPGVVTVNLGLSHPENSRVYEFPALRADARLTGRLVTRDGAAATRLAGLPVLIKNFPGRRAPGTDRPTIRRVTTVAPDGTFAFDGLMPGVYAVSFGDLDYPGVIGATVEILPDSTAVSVRVVDFLASRAGGAAAKSADAAHAPIINQVEQDGSARPAAPRDGAQSKSEPAVSPGGVQFGLQPAAAAKEAACQDRQPDGTATFIAMSRATGQEVTCDVSFTVAQGTAQVGIEVHVATLEYPKYTRARSDYDDTWRFSVQDTGLDYLTASSSVNDSHDEFGTRKWSACVDMKKRTADGPVTLTGTAAATGVGDSLHATSVRILIGTRCDREFKVVAARLSSPGPSGHPMIGADEGRGNVAGRYLSIVPPGVSPLYKLPLKIAFQPAGTRIDKVELGLQHGAAAPVFAADNLLAQPARIVPGEIEFAGLTLPQWPVGRTDELVRLVVRLTGTLDGRNVVSDAVAGGRITFGGKETFTPLYQAGDEPALAARRYGGRPDPGGDSWATMQTIAWLASKPYRFNDVSAQHVLQTATRRSVLNHRGHSDGQQIDLRYADGQGGYSEAMGGANHGQHIRTALVQAQAEVRGDAAHKPNLARVTAWVTDNRRIIGEQAAAPEVRQIFVGRQWLEAALIHGRFPDGSAIPGLGAWKHSPKIQSADEHLHHWHVSLAAAPAGQSASDR